jgi:hypothetical protein
MTSPELLRRPSPSGKKLEDATVTAKHEIIDALNNGAGHQRLLVILRSHAAELSGPKAAYRLLEEIWKELGLNQGSEDSELRDELEFAMERTWYTSVADPAVTQNRWESG